MKKKEGGKVGGRFYGRARTRALAHQGNIIAFWVEWRVLDDVLVRLVLLAETGPEHMPCWTSGFVTEAQSP